MVLKFYGGVIRKKGLQKLRQEGDNEKKIEKNLMEDKPVNRVLM